MSRTPYSGRTGFNEIDYEPLSYIVNLNVSILFQPESIRDKNRFGYGAPAGWHWHAFDGIAAAAGQRCEYDASSSQRAQLPHGRLASTAARATKSSNNIFTRRWTYLPS